MDMNSGIIVWRESCACGGSFRGQVEDECTPDCAGYLPDEEETAKARLFAAADRGHRDTSRLTFINHGGRTRLQVIDHDGRTVRLAPAIHRRLAVQFIDAAHVYARAAHGARRTWPARFTVER